MGITPWPGGEREKSIHSFVGGELSFLKLGAVLVGLSGGRESSLVQTFCESCVHFDITHPSVHITRRSVIQGCPTLTIPTLKKKKKKKKHSKNIF